MFSSSNKTPVPMTWLGGQPWLAAVLSLLVPGLGQALLGWWGRGFTILGIVAGSLVIIWWQGMLALLALVLFIWLWNAWDAYGLAGSRPRSLVPPVLAGLAVVYVAGWIVTGISPDRLLRQADRMVPILGGMLTPDYAERQREYRQERAPFEVHCSDNPPPVTTSYKEGGTLTLSASCGEVGDRLTVTGNNFWPNAVTELWWANPIGQEQRLTRDGQPLGLTTDESGSFSFDITVPLAVPLSTDTGAPQPHAVQVNQSRVVGSVRLSTNGLLVLQKMGETIALALMATTFAVVFAIPLSFVAARNLMSGNMITVIVYYVIRTVLNVVRSIESLIIAIIFVVWVGLGPFAGVMALTIHSIAALAKLYSEQVENIELGPIDAIRATGANWLQIVVYAVLPQVVPPFLAFTIYRWDINVRTSTIIGFVGGGGIGFLLVQWQRLNDWRAIGAAFWSIMVVVAILDYVSAKVRERVG